MKFKILNSEEIEKLKYMSGDEVFMDDLIGYITSYEDYYSNNYSYKEIYAALCNNIWYNPEKKLEVGVSWRAAGTLASELWNKLKSPEEKLHDYLDYYCHGEIGEGWVEPKLYKYLYTKGWLLAKYVGYADETTGNYKDYCLFVNNEQRKNKLKKVVEE